MAKKTALQRLEEGWQYLYNAIKSDDVVYKVFYAEAAMDSISRITQPNRDDSTRHKFLIKYDMIRYYHHNLKATNDLNDLSDFADDFAAASAEVNVNALLQKYPPVVIEPLHSEVPHPDFESKFVFDCGGQIHDQRVHVAQTCTLLLIMLWRGYTIDAGIVDDVYKCVTNKKLAMPVHNTVNNFWIKNDDQIYFARYSMIMLATYDVLSRDDYHNGDSKGVNDVDTLLGSMPGRSH